jgi:hypothetical protein
MARAELPTPEGYGVVIASIRHAATLMAKGNCTMEDTTLATFADVETEAAETFARALRRAQGEFMEMPGLRLTEAQAARLWSFDSRLCSAVLTALVESRFLIRSRNAFSRA